MRDNKLLINALPAPTFNWLRMNDADVQVPNEISEGNPVVTRPEDIKVLVTNYGEIKDIPGGMGYDMDTFVQESGVDILKIKTKDGQKASFPVRMEFDYTKTVNAVNAVYIDAGDNSDITVVMDFSYDNSHSGFAAIQTKVRVGKNARVLLVQVQRLGSDFKFLNDIASRTDDNGSFEEIQLVLGGKETYQGSRTDLLGKGSSLKTDVGYLIKGHEHLDMNHIANHIGEKTTCELDINGVLRDKAFKLFRGTIDLRKGAKGAHGNELEDVLLMDDTVINQTIPVILCDEDDVEGNHGATIGRLDDSMLFYLESRGMDRANVYEMMASARIDAVISKIPDEATRNDIFLHLRGHEEERYND